MKIILLLLIPAFLTAQVSFYSDYYNSCDMIVKEGDYTIENCTKVPDSTEFHVNGNIIKYKHLSISDYTIVNCDKKEFQTLCKLKNEYGKRFLMYYDDSSVDIIFNIEQKDTLGFLNYRIYKIAYQF